jgi:HD superfamily phosphohydrolase
MSIFALRNEDAAGAVAQRVDIWTESILRPYLQKRASNPYTGNKTLHDNVWGMIRLRRNELYILDSPLLQRLRYIRQLGVAHYLFPTTGYSRFEHTFGAVQKASDLFNALKDNGSPRPPPNLEDEYHYATRLAALFHDVGHCPFSHVSEKFYQELDEVADAVRQLSQFYHDKDNVSASELLSILIVSSPATVELVANAGGDFGGELSATGLPEFICACIAGSTKRTKPASYLAQIINGTIDCDKLDYIRRDALMAGTPVMLDAARLLSKLRVAYIEAAEQYELAIDISGARALEEMIASRVFLYDKLYYHQKVLAAESILLKAFDILAEHCSTFHDPVELLSYTDEELLQIQPGTLIDRYGVTDAAAQAAVEAATNLFRRVRDRDLPKRVLAFAPRFRISAPQAIALLETGKTNSTVFRNHAKVTSFLAELEERSDLRREIAESIADEAAKTEQATNVYVAWPSSRRVAGRVGIHAMDAEGQTTSFDFLFAVGRWTEAYTANKVTGYVFADAPSGRIFLAAEMIFARWEADWNSRSWTMAKMPQRSIDLERAKLPLAHVQFRRPATFLRERAQRGRIESVAGKLEQVHRQHNLVAEQLLRGWLWQFPDSDYQESALRIAEQLLIINPHLRGVQRRDFVKRILDEEGDPGLWTLAISRRSSRARSANLLAYYLQEESVELGNPELLPRLDLRTLAAAPHIVVADDWICSGNQMSSLLYSWFDHPERVLSLDDVDDPLSAELQAVLKEKRIRFFFHVGFTEGVELLKETIEQLGLNASVDVALHADQEGYVLSPELFDSVESFDRIKRFLTARGVELLHNKHEANPAKWDAERVQKYALGYGGRAALFCSEYSVPTATLTPIWSFRYEEDGYWLPLIPRPRYRDDVKARLKPLLVGGFLRQAAE